LVLGKIIMEVVIMMVLDPVCRMELEKESTKYASEFMGHIYYFDSMNCMHEFEDEPEAFAELIPSRMYDEHGERLDGSE
jgi:YHS domain-containing protein